jgi:hypothetical protein
MGRASSISTHPHERSAVRAPPDYHTSPSTTAVALFEAARGGGGMAGNGRLRASRASGHQARGSCVSCVPITRRGTFWVFPVPRVSGIGRRGRLHRDLPNFINFVQFHILV